MSLDELFKNLNEQYPILTENTQSLLKKHNDTIVSAKELSNQLLYAGIAILKSNINSVTAGVKSIRGNSQNDYRPIQNLVTDLNEIAKIVRKLENYKDNFLNKPNKYFNTINDKIDEFDKNNNRAADSDKAIQTKDSLKLSLRDLSAIASVLLEAKNEGKVNVTEKATKALEILSCISDNFHKDNTEVDPFLTMTVSVYKNNLNEPSLKNPSISIGNYAVQAINRFTAFDFRLHTKIKIISFANQPPFILKLLDYISSRL